MRTWVCSLPGAGFVPGGWAGGATSALTGVETEKTSKTNKTTISVRMESSSL